ncbi:hypothetical protein NEOLEDRAFT_1083099 [Neolentinus lepideus HHB14362 ss-1]|uniref:DNA replication regulator SLD2 n=1 Tax=Neolentinus lepideus HHB14362 ss-1 TaxID=1314782 RepID=A0A165W6N9_9AGAM|nr:hypothetical protein NEOLEDRAFT_1083099 [Neolentinus lepideus HHB14362 ss-1]
MSDNVAQLRTEIKTWERDFRQRHGCPPSVQDIKDQPAIAEKYKLYKRLSKATPSQASIAKPTTSDPPSTPPRSQPGPSRGSFIAAKARAVHIAAPSSTVNPFSPAKNKGKQKEATRIFERDGERFSNPFATPTKSKTVRRLVSPDPFPLIELAQPATPKYARPHDPNRHAVSRARKRLRGEPVSPSPVKEKRQRVGSQTLLPFSKLNQSQPASSDDDEELNRDEGDSSFIDESPVKPPTNGKSFRLLFDEKPVNKQSDAKSRGALSRSKTIPNNTSLFPGQKDKAVIASAMDEDNAKPFPSSQPLPGTRVSKPSRSGAIGRAKKPSALMQVMLGGFIPAKDDLYADAQPSDSAQFSKGAASTEKPGTRSPPARGSTKRPLAAMEVDSVQTKPGSSQNANDLSLLPPSPPPQKPAKSYQGKGKGKEMSKGGGRKKVKVVDNPDEDDDSPEEPDVRVKVSDWSWNRSRSLAPHTNTEDADLNDDLDMSLTLRTTRNEILAPDSLIREEGGNFDVDLPDHLRSVLSISPTKMRARKEEYVVRELLYRERASHYNPVKGGEIWDVGEGDDDTKASTEGEDDWEGEPVPWEVGEL